MACRRCIVRLKVADEPASVLNFLIRSRRHHAARDRQHSPVITGLNDLRVADKMTVFSA